MLKKGISLLSSIVNIISYSVMSIEMILRSLYIRSCIEDQETNKSIEKINSEDPELGKKIESEFSKYRSKIKRLLIIFFYLVFVYLIITSIF